MNPVKDETAEPTLTEEELRRRCQYVSMNLLSMLEGKSPPGSLSSTAVRELMIETPRCDQFCNTKFSTTRKAYSAYMKKYGDLGTEERIRELNQTPKDELVAASVLNHYNTWTQYRIVATLNYHNWFKYQFWVKTERTLAFFGIVSSVYGVRSLVKSSHRWYAKFYAKTGKE